MRFRYSISFLLLAGALLTGCIKHTVAVPPSQRLLKAESMTKPQLLEHLKIRSGAIKTLMVTKSSLKLTKPKSDEQNDVLGNPKLINGILLVDRQSHQIRIQVDSLGSTAADLVSSDRQYSVSVPLRNQFGVADAAAPVDEKSEFPFNLRPNHFFDALFVDGDQYIEDTSILTSVHEATEEQPGGLHSFYVIDFTRTQGGVRIAELWFDRTFSEIGRKITYKQDGRVELDVRYSNYQTVSGTPFPRMIFFSRPTEHYSLEMKLEELELNKDIEPGKFIMERPPGSADLDLITGKVTKKP